jgi:hypothetical protein
MVHKKTKINFFIISLAIIVIYNAWGENKDKSESKAIVLQPQIKISNIPETKYSIQYKYLEPYLESVVIIEDPKLKKTKSKAIINKPYINQGKLIIESEYFQKDKFKQGLKTFFSSKKNLLPKEEQRYVVGLEHPNRSMAGKKDLVFVKGITQENSWRYMFVEPKAAIYHPVTKEYLGTEVLIIGKGKVIKRAPISVLEIELARKPIKAGALVIPSKSFNLAATIPAVFKNKKMSGFIVSLISDAKRIATHSVAIVSVGLKDGAEVGQVLKIKNVDRVLQDPYKKNKKYILPVEEPKGELMLYEVFEKLSLGIVLKSSSEIQMLDVTE